MAQQDIRNRVRGSVNLDVAAFKYEQRLQISPVYTSYPIIAQQEIKTLVQDPANLSFIALQHSSTSNAFK